MKDSYASKWQRFAAFMIDMILIYTISYFLLILAYKIFGYVSNRSELLDAFVKDFEAFLKGKDNSVYYRAMDRFYAFLNVYFIESLYSTICNFIIGAIYLVLIPLFANFQTLGRLAARVKVVTTYGEKPKLKNLLLREIVGALFLQTSAICLIVSIVLVVKKDGSVIDYISRCRLVQKTFDKRIMELEEIKDNDEDNQEINIYPDSEILNEEHEIKEEPKTRIYTDDEILNEDKKEEK